MALWKAKLNQAEDVVNSTERAAYRIEVPGPIKDNILQYLGSAKGEDVEGEDIDIEDERRRMLYFLFSF